MKKSFLIFFALFLLLPGCSGGKHSGMTEQQRTDYTAQTAIKEQIENTAIPKGYSTLLEDDGFVTVTCSEGEAKVTIKAFMPYIIPYVAELFLPVAQEAADEAGVTLAEFRVESYNKNKDGIVSNTFASWGTTDGEKGHLSDNTSGEAIVKQNLTIEQVYEYYSDYKAIVSGMIVEAGGEALVDADGSEILREPEETSAASTTYWINPETKKFHVTNCSYIQGGHSTTESRGSLIAKGYSPCGHCNP